MFAVLGHQEGKHSDGERPARLGLICKRLMLVFE